MEYKQINFESLNETLYEYTHPSGLRAFVLPKKGYYKKFAAFATNYGSVDNEFISPGDAESTKVPDGIAHFLEHKLFDQKDGNVMDKYCSLGATPNAYTSFTQTVYWFSCTENFSECFNLLLDFVQNPYITEESVEREKGIIGQEIKMYEDDPSWRVYFNLLNTFFNSHPVKKDIAGTVESISHINREILYKCFKTFYDPSNMVIIAGGDIDHEEVFRVVEKLIPSEPKKDTIKRIFPNEEQKINKNYIEQSMEVSIPLFYMGYKDLLNPGGGKPLLRREVAIKIIMEMMLGKGSDIYSHMYNQGLIDDSFGYDYTIEPDYAYSMIGGESQNPMEVKDNILKEVKLLKESGFDQKYFDRIKKMLKGRFVRNLNSVDKPCRSMVSMYFKDVNTFDYYEIYDNIDMEYTYKVFLEHFDESRLAMSVIKPLKA